MELASKYSPQEVEGKWYEYWLKNGLFKSKPDGREPYTIVIPPPNVTGVLHMGHMLNNTIQDILVRKARLDGKNALWVPGTDHASIATEAKVVNRLAEQGIKKCDLSREQFLQHAWEWTHEHGGIILKQLRRLGASCDWDRTAFTMDETRSESVLKVFVDLYRKGLIYRGLRMVNWDPKAQTVLSTEEVIYRDEKSKLYYLKYYLEDCNGVDGKSAEADGCVIHRDEKGYYAVVATTRPETIMGDTAMCINPKDPKNQWLHGKKVIVPLVGRVIPVIEDRYVDIEFGTGCLKVTPAHDINDYQLGKTHNLETIDIFNPDGTISDQSPLYVGMNRMEVRRQIVKDLEIAGLVEKIEDYENKVGYSERNPDTAVEPRLCKQWFLSMKHFADIALPPVLEGKIKFHPQRYVTTYRNWLENIQDWCISRQLWWGHRIPAWFLPVADEEEERYVVALNEDEAVALGLVAPGAVGAADEDHDVLCVDGRGRGDASVGGAVDAAGGPEQRAEGLAVDSLCAVFAYGLTLLQSLAERHFQHFLGVGGRQAFHLLGKAGDCHEQGEGEEDWFHWGYCCGLKIFYYGWFSIHRRVRPMAVRRSTGGWGAMRRVLSSGTMLSVVMLRRRKEVMGKRMPALPSPSPQRAARRIIQKGTRGIL